MPVEFDNRINWRKRFQSETAFEWLTSSSIFVDIISPYLDRLDPQKTEILHLGCGTSDLHNHLRKKGFINVTNIDYEPLALERGQQLERREFGDIKTKYRVADVTQLEPDHSEQGKCQLAIEKSTSDALSCSGDEAVVSMAQKIHKCLDPKDGLWISLSYSDNRFDLEGIKDLFDVQVVSKVPTEKRLETDPDIWHWCYSLKPKWSEI